MDRYVYTHSAAVGSKLEPFISELAMEGYISENPNILKLREDDTPIVGELEKEWREHGKENGRIDLLVSYGDSYAVVELKKGELDKKAFNQLIGYMSKKEAMQKASKDVFGDISDDCRWEGVLVGTSLHNDLKNEITEHNKDGEHPIAAIVLNRYRSGDQLFVVTDVFYPLKKGQMRSFYLVDGKRYSKSKLGVGMIQSFVDKHPALTVSGLKQKLNGILRDGKPIVEEVGIVTADWRKYHHFHNEKNGLISLVDGDVLVQGFWTETEMPIVDKIKSVLGCSYEPIS